MGAYHDKLPDEPAEALTVTAELIPASGAEEKPRTCPAHAASACSKKAV